jgi:hypothetical protein
MMKSFLILFFVLISTLPLNAQKKDFRLFIPNNYDTLYEGVARGDLNKDGIEDLAMVIYSKWEDDSDWIKKSEDNLPKRLLIILFGTNEGYIKIAESANAVLCKACGGVFGDPFAAISINKNVLQIDHYGGSNWRWEITHKFRYQTKEFFLIGKTTNSYLSVEQCDKLHEMAGTKFEDVNFLTGQYERKEISEDCKLLENKKGKKKIEPLISLAKFEIDN